MSIRQSAEAGRGPDAPLTPDRQKDASSAEALGFWTRVRAHKVAQWTLAYAAAAYTLLHVVEMVGEALDWPHLVARVVTLALFVGAPVVVTLAWYHGHRALRRVSGPELSILIVLLFIAASVLWFVGRPNHERASATGVGEDRRSSVLKTPVTEPVANSIAVLPFVDLSESQDQVYFGAGVAEEIVSVLASLPGMKVIGRTSSFRFKATDDDVRQIGLKLHAAYILGGSVRRSGQHVRVTAQLIDAHAGIQIWSASYDRNVTDVLSIQEEISAGIARALQIAVGASGEHSVRRVQSGDAYDYYLRGLYALDRLTPDSLLEAKNNLQQAITLDPDFVPALEALTLTNYEIGEDEDVPPHVAWQAARAGAERTLQLDKHSATAHGVLGFVYAFDEFNWARADAEIHEALAASRRNPATLLLASEIALAEGRAREATELISVAVTVDPLNAYAHQVMGFVRELSGDRAGAEAAFRRSLMISPQMDGGHYQLAELLIARGQPDSALAELEGEVSADAKDCGLALAYDALGRKAEADAALDRLTRADADLWPFALAEVYAHRGSGDEAFRWLERAYTARDFDMPRRLRLHPFFTRFHEDRRFAALLRKMNLPE